MNVWKSKEKIPSTCVKTIICMQLELERLVVSLTVSSIPSTNCVKIAETNRERQ